MAWGTGPVVAGVWIVAAVTLAAADPDVLTPVTESIIITAALLLLPAALVTAALVSGGGLGRALSAVLWGGVVLAGLALLLDEPIPVTAMAAGVTVGTAVAVPTAVTGPVVAFRAVFGVITVGYVALVTSLAPAFGVVVAPFLPMAAMAVADAAARARTSRRGHRVTG